MADDKSAPWTGAPHGRWRDRSKDVAVASTAAEPAAFSPHTSEHAQPLPTKRMTPEQIEGVERTELERLQAKYGAPE